MKMRSVMEHAFSLVPSAEIPRSSFDRSHGHKTTFDGGLLIPIFLDEALPGDTFNCHMTGFARLATPIFPVMDNMFMDTFFFAVPMRLLWDNWQRFCGERDNPEESIDFLIPTINPVEIPFQGGLADYFGLPAAAMATASTTFVSAMPFRAYNLIWNEWFRDQNLQTRANKNMGDGPDDLSDFPLRRRGKRHDYFTSCLPWPQKGDAVSLPLGLTAPVVGDGDPPTFQHGAVAGVNLSVGGADTDVQLTGGTSAGIIFWSDPSLEVNLSAATAATINQLRQAFQVQRLLERDARGGTRYVEVIRSHFGVISPDQRLQRPEYLGGGSSPVNIVAVAQTSETAGTPQGNLSGYGTAVLNNHGFTKSFTEHCLIIGLVSVRADLTYQQGINRLWSRQTRYDFYWPALSHIGEQAVLNKEIFAVGNAPVGSDDQVFGYIPRYDEYRYKPSLITGLFRSDATGSLDPWHLAIDFPALPLLNAEFIEDNPPIDRVIAVTTEPHFLFDAYFNLRCARPMPTFGVPGMIDHF